MLRLKDILKISLKRLLEVCVVYLFFSILSAYSFYFSFFLSFFLSSLFNYFFGNTKYCFFLILF